MCPIVFIVSDAQPDFDKKKNQTSILQILIPFSYVCVCVRRQKLNGEVKTNMIHFWCHYNLACGPTELLGPKLISLRCCRVI